MIEIILMSTYGRGVTEYMAIKELNTTEEIPPEVQYPKSLMPAWVPAVTVATGMMIFLAASFYLRHRKVMKKRQILMDYFYIIFQYGGLRRKRMVAALCNTNSITLRQLGRSFMISFDSIANNENSCPFYLEDSAFTNASGTPQRRKLFRSKSKSGGGNKLRPPSRTPSPSAQMYRKPHYQQQQQQQQKQHQYQHQQYQYSHPPQMHQQNPSPGGFQEIRMKFKSRVNPRSSPEPYGQNQMHLMPPRLGSLSSIHDDDPADAISFHDIQSHEGPQSARIQERRNAYVFSYDSSGSIILEEEFEKPPIPNSVLKQLQQQSSSGKRNSEPIYHDGGYNPHPQTQLKVLPDDGTKIYGTRVLYPSADHLSRSESGTLYRNSEPTIMIHSASNDFGSSFELQDVQSQCSNGLVFVKEVTNENGSTERYYINERPTQGFSKNHRASLSKVSYVPSGNMNEYYQSCLSSPKKSKPCLQHSSEESGSHDSKTDEKTKPGWFTKKNGPGSKKTTEMELPTPPISRSGRLSLGEIAISNFNRRVVDFPSESFGSNHEMDDPNYVNVPKEQQPTKSSSTWRRLKNVFSGSRSSQSSASKRSLQGSEDRGKRVGKRPYRKWKRFVNVLMGFRSLPDSKSAIRNKSSNSLPMGLDKQMRSQDEFDFRTSFHAKSLDSNSSYYVQKGPEHQCLPGILRSRMVPPPCMKAPPKTRSFPDDMLKMQDSTESSNFLPYPPGISPRKYASSLRNTGQKSKRQHASCESYLPPGTHADTHRHYYHQTSSQSSGDDPFYRQYHNMSSMSSPRSKSPIFSLPTENDGFHAKNRERSCRNPSPLPDRWFKHRRKSNASRFYSHSERSSFSERGQSVLPYLAYSADFAFPLGLINERLCSDCGSRKSPKNSNFMSIERLVNKNSKSSSGNLDQMNKDYHKLSVNHDNSVFTHRHSISGPTCNGHIANDSKPSAHRMGLDSSEKTPMKNYKSFTLDVNPSPSGNSLESVYFDTVSVLGSPNSIKQSTAPNTPLYCQDTSKLDFSSPHTNIPSTNPTANTSSQPFNVPPLNSSHQSQPSQYAGNTPIERHYSNLSHNGLESQILVVPEKSPETTPASNTKQRVFFEDEIGQDAKPSVIPCASLPIQSTSLASFFPNVQQTPPQSSPLYVNFSTIEKPQTQPNPIYINFPPAQTQLNPISISSPNIHPAPTQPTIVSVGSSNFQAATVPIISSNMQQTSLTNSSLTSNVQPTQSQSTLFSNVTPDVQHIPAQSPPPYSPTPAVLPMASHRLSFHSQPSTASNDSGEHQTSSGSSMTSVISVGKGVKSIDDLLRQSLDQASLEEEEDELSPLLGHSPPLTESLDDLESNVTSSETNPLMSEDTNVTTHPFPLPLDLVSQGGARFHIVSETGRRNSPEEAAIMNLTRLPRFGRRVSQCTPSPLSESRPDSTASTPVQASGTETVSTLKRDSTTTTITTSGLPEAVVSTL